MRLANAQSIVFTGDSITDCGRERPVGRRGGLGSGYVALVDSLLTAFYPQRRIRVLNTGIGGNRVIDLEARWRPDVLERQPDWLSILIGINDVWRHFDSEDDINQVSLERFEAVYRKLLEAARAKVKGLVLMAPFFFEPNPADPMRERMDAYGRVVKRLAAAFDAGFVDLQAAFDRYLQHRPSQSLCADRVHPNQTGHIIIASAFLNAVDFDWNRGSPDAETCR